VYNTEIKVSLDCVNVAKQFSSTCCLITIPLYSIVKSNLSAKFTSFTSCYQATSSVNNGGESAELAMTRKRHLFRPRERLRSIVMSMSVCGCVYLSVCPLGYLENHTRDHVHVAYVRVSVLLRHVDDRQHRLSPGRGFLPHWQFIVQHSIWDPYKNGWTDRHGVLHDKWAWPDEQCTWGDDPRRGRGNLGKTCPTSLTPFIIATSPTKDRFPLNLLIYRKVGHKSNILLLKDIIWTNYFEISRKLKQKRNG